MDIKRDEVDAAVEVDGPAGGIRIKQLADFSRAKPNAALFSPRPRYGRSLMSFAAEFR
jgi:hypothetical protein